MGHPGSLQTGFCNADLLASLTNKTTWPPLLYSNVVADSISTILQPQVAREVDGIDLGYAYDPLDYLVSSYAFSNATVTISPGTAIGYIDYAGIWLDDNARIICSGSPTALNRFVDYRTVQEQAVKLGSWGTSTGMGVLPYRAHSAGPGQFRFTAFSRMAPGGSAPYDFYLSGSWNYTTLDIRDCAFLNGGLVIQDSSEVTATLENNLFERTVFFAADSMVLDLHNNLFRGGSVQLDSWGDTVWVIKDNAFDDCSLSADWITPYDHGRNAYINATQIDASLTNDVVMTNFAYVAGPLGKYYQLSTNLINAGSRTADMAGLYHWTTQTNQVKETNSTVDIGFHYVAVDTNGLAIDSDDGGVADFLEDSSGDGVVNGDESDWTSGMNHGSDDFKHLLTPEYLRVEYRENPWGVDAEDPWLVLWPGNDRRSLLASH